MHLKNLKRKEKKPKYMSSSVLNIIPFLFYDDNIEAFKLQSGKYFDLLQIKGISRDHISEEYKNYLMSKYWLLYKKYGADFKYYFLYFKSSTKSQKAHLIRISEKIKNPVLRGELERKFRELDYLEKHRFYQEYYVGIFANTPEELYKYRNDVLSTLEQECVMVIDKHKKYQILFKIYNKNSPYGELNDFFKEPDIKKDHDYNMLRFIQPRGGISFRDDAYIKTGYGYEQCIHIYGTSMRFDDYWMTKICNIPNTLVTIDVSTENMDVIKKNINKSISEKGLESQGASEFTTAYDAHVTQREIQDLYVQITNMGEIIKIVQIRIFVFDPVQSELEKRTQKIIKDLELSEIGSCVYLLETETEFLSSFETYKQQKAHHFSQAGISLTSQDLSIGMPFIFSALEDKNGTHFGYTPTNGNFLFDLFHSDVNRKSFSAMVFGMLGMGKSTMLKKIFLDRAARGDYVRTFDVTGEFAPLTRYCLGKVIKLDGSEGMLNLLEILKIEEDEGTNYLRHLGKVHTVFKFIAPGMTLAEEEMLDEELSKLYSRYNILTPDGKVADRQITGLPAKAYPTLGDLLDQLQDEINELVRQKSNMILTKDIELKDMLRRTIENLCNNYGRIFNGHSTIENILGEKIVTFDISSLININERIFDAQMSNILSLCWDNALQNGSVYKEMYDQGKISNDEVTHTVIIIDEAPQWVNARRLQAIETIKLYISQARKWFTGFVFAAQTIRSFFPEGSDTTGINEIKAIFELAQYHFIFKQSESSLDLLRNAYGSKITEAELTMIPKLSMGQCVASISADESMYVKIDPTKQELDLFAGGI